MIVWLPDHLIGQACLKEISVKSGAAFQIEKNAVYQKNRPFVRLLPAAGSRMIG